MYILIADMLYIYIYIIYTVIAGRALCFPDNVYIILGLASVRFEHSVCRSCVNHLILHMEYVLVKRPQLGRFYLLPKIHKRKTNVPGRPVISNNQTAIENIS